MSETASKIQKPLLLLALITLVGILLRFHNYATFSLFNDELSALTRLQFSTFNNLIEKGVKPDMHPAGVQLLLFLITRLFGNSEAVIRLPFVLAGILAIPLIYAIGKKMFNETAGLLTSSALAVLQYPVYFSQQARPYSLGLLFCLLMVYFLLKIIESGKKGIPVKNSWYAGFILSGVCCMYIHYFSFLFAGIIGLSAFFLVNKTQVRPIIYCGMAMVLLGLPHFSIYKHQLMIGGLGGPGGWLGPPDENTFRKYIYYIFNESNLLYLSFLGLGIVSFIYFRKTLFLSRYHLICITYFLLPFLVAYFYSVYVNPVLQFSILIFSFPFFLLFLFSFFPDRLAIKFQTILVVLILSTGCYSTVLEKKYYTTEHYGVFKELAERTIELNEKYKDINITNTINVFDPYFINYYFTKFNRPVSMAQYRCMEPDKLTELRDIINQSTTPYFLHAWSNTFDPPEVDDLIRTQYPYRILHDKHFNSELSFYSRNKSDSLFQKKLVFSAFHDFEYCRWLNDTNFKSNSMPFHGNFSAKLDEFEFGNSFSSSLKRVNFKIGQQVSVSFWANTAKLPTGASIVVTIQDRDGKSIFWQSGLIDAFIQKPLSWQQVFFTCYPTGELKDGDELKVFVWNQEKQALYIDDLSITISEP